MQEKSRVILYAELRKKISCIDNYSFASENPKENDDKAIEHDEIPVSSPNENNVIKRNTLSISIDELIKERDRYDSIAQEKETRKRYHDKKKEEKIKKKISASKVIIWSSISVVVIAFVVLLTLLLLEVI